MPAGALDRKSAQGWAHLTDDASSAVVANSVVPATGRFSRSRACAPSARNSKMTTRFVLPPHHRLDKLSRRSRA